uniref:(California timema) hypothetical protein n=1 Tax=Timema californicum TaxID=61474 RepID=A0A7R9J5U4_TIMCA|nr:unnamed protein product [Timema californicum]
MDFATLGSGPLSPPINPPLPSGDGTTQFMNHYSSAGVVLIVVCSSVSTWGWDWSGFDLPSLGILRDLRRSKDKIKGLSRDTTRCGHLAMEFNIEALFMKFNSIQQYGVFTHTIIINADHTNRVASEYRQSGAAGRARIFSFGASYATTGRSPRTTGITTTTGEGEEGGATPQARIYGTTTGEGEELLPGREDVALQYRVRGRRGATPQARRFGTKTTGEREERSYSPGKKMRLYNTGFLIPLAGYYSPSMQHRDGHDVWITCFRSERHDEVNQAGVIASSTPGAVRHKIVMMGAAKVGKSSLISQFLYGTFSPKYKRTIEEMHHGDFNVGGVSLTLDILDTSGSYEFPAMRALSISSAEAFVLVYDITDADTFEEVRTLRDQIHETKGNTAVPIVVVGNKVDLAEEGSRQVEFSTTESVVTVDWENGFVESSAKDNTNVTLVFKELLAQAKVKYNLSPALRKKRRQSMARHSISEGSTASPSTHSIIPSPSQLQHLEQIRERHSGSKRNSCTLS